MSHGFIEPPNNRFDATHCDLTSHFVHLHLGLAHVELNYKLLVLIQWFVLLSVNFKFLFIDTLQIIFVIFVCKVRIRITCSPYVVKDALLILG